MLNNIDEKTLVEVIIRNILEKQKYENFTMLIPVGVSNRHVHLSLPDAEKLFGEGYEFTVMKELSQPGYFAANETVTLVGPKGVLTKVRVLGPLRKNTQVELLLSDGYTLGTTPPVQESGTYSDTPCLTIVGPKGAISICKGVMGAWRHIHMSGDHAAALGIKDGDMVRVRTGGSRSLIFNNVKVRANEKFITELHLDVEEANASYLKNGDKVELLGLEVR